jgi:hypothetical protein
LIIERINVFVAPVMFRLLYMRSNRLDHWETFEAESALEAIERAAGRPSNDVVELWSDQGRIATFRPVGRHHHGGR